MPPAVTFSLVYLLAAAIKQAGTVDGPEVRMALDDLKGTIEGVVQVYHHPFNPANHEAVASANVVYGIVKDGRVVQLTAGTQAAGSVARIPPAAE